MRNEAFVGGFKALLQDYVNVTLGYKFETTPANLRRFSEFSLAYDVKNK